MTYDIMSRGFVSKFMGAHSVLDWDSIILRTLLLGRASENGKQRDFYVRMRRCKDAEVYQQLSDPKYGLHLMSDDYILEELIEELRDER